MIFNSATYILFLLLVVVLYWVLPKKPRQVLLFLSSLVFYGFWRVEFTLLILVSAVNDYILSILIDRSEKQKTKKSLLIVSLIVNLGLLFYFKYLMFFAENAINILSLFGVEVEAPRFSIILPLGISFYTFQTISYTVDVYRGFLKPYRNFFLYGSYVTFFPQLVAGPILRAKEVISQLEHRKKFKLSFFTDGIIRILFGLFLKVVLADNIAPIVDEIYAVSSANLSAIDIWAKAFSFGFQIYFDFAAYSHIAIGSALLMGIEFPENFNYPYLAKSFKSFWKRWHISLSSWIRDYLYLPLIGVKVLDKSTGGIEVQKPKSSVATRALFLTWGIMGLWHGASWAFVFWGLYHAFLVYAERLVKKIEIPIQSNLKKILGWMVTLPLVMLGWIPFRENSMQDVLLMYKKVILFENITSRSFSENVYLIVGVLMILTIVSYLVHEFLLEKLKRSRVLYLLILMVVISILTVMNLTFLRPISQFIYFQF